MFGVEQCVGGESVLKGIEIKDRDGSKDWGEKEGEKMTGGRGKEKGRDFFVETCNCMECLML